jgi:hypothetical protein
VERTPSDRFDCLAVSHSYSRSLKRSLILTPDMPAWIQRTQSLAKPRPELGSTWWSAFVAVAVAVVGVDADGAGEEGVASAIGVLFRR